MAASVLSVLLSQPTFFFSSSKFTKSPHAVLDKPRNSAVPYQLKQGQSRVFHQLPSGLNMEVIEQKGKRGSGNIEIENPPLVFVHGSYHAAWCWAEHWLPFFSSFDYDCYALSLLAQGESDEPDGSVAGTLQTHAGDVADFIHKKLKSPPVLLGHSFGGLIIQYYLANTRNAQDLGKKTVYPDLAGAVLICSVPPSGNSGLVWRYLFSKPLAAFKVTLSLAAKFFQTNLSLCKETFFTSTMDDHLVMRYQELMKESSRMPLFDLRKLNASLPVPPVRKSSIDVLVLGCASIAVFPSIDGSKRTKMATLLYPHESGFNHTNDIMMAFFVIDAEGLDETARFYDVPPICIEGVAHDMMLDCSWEEGARVILSWLNRFSR